MAGAGQQAELTRLKRELTLTEKNLDDLKDINNQLRNDNEDLTQKLQNRARREGESTILMERLNDVRQQLREAERSRDALKKDNNELQLDLKTAKDQLTQEASTADQAELNKLKSEIESIKKKSRLELSALQAELDEALKKHNAEPQNNHHLLELEVLRQENTQLKQSLSDRGRDLQTSQETGQLLEDELEDANRAIDEMRRQLERQEESLARQQFAQGSEKVSASESHLDWKSPAIIKVAGVAGIVGFLLALVILSVFSADESGLTTATQNPAVSKPSSGQIIRN